MFLLRAKHLVPPVCLALPCPGHHIVLDTEAQQVDSASGFF